VTETPGPDGGLVTLSGVSVDYRTRTRWAQARPRPRSNTLAIEDVDLRVPEGALVGIVGPSGSGKTTVLRVLTGALRPTAGVARRRPGLRVGYVPQMEAVDWSFPVSVADVALMGRRPAHRWPWTTPAEREAAADVLDQLGLAGLEDRHISELSGGQQQRVFVARALLQDVDLLVLDEPTAGVDIRTRHDLLHRLADLNRSRGVAIVLSTHDLNGMAAHLPHVVCVNRTIVAEGPPATVLVPDVLERTFGAPMDVLRHSGLPVVVDRHRPGAGMEDHSTPGHHHVGGHGGDPRPVQGDQL